MSTRMYTTHVDLPDYLHSCVVKRLPTINVFHGTEQAMKTHLHRSFARQVPHAHVVHGDPARHATPDGVLLGAALPPGTEFVIIVTRATVDRAGYDAARFNFVRFDPQDESYETNGTEGF